MSDYNDKPVTQDSITDEKIDTMNIQEDLSPDVLERGANTIPALANFWCIALTVVEQDIAMVINLNGDLMLGRADGNEPGYTFIDLSAYNAHRNGVSRQHAVITLKNSRVTLMDNESSNRTLLNDKKLVPFEQYPLQPGDIISLGRLELQFDLIFDPFGV